MVHYFSFILLTTPEHTHLQELGQARCTAAAMAASEAGVPSFGATPKAAREMERKAAGGRNGAMVHYFFVVVVVWCLVHDVS